MNDRELKIVTQAIEKIQSADTSRLPPVFKCDRCERVAESYMVTSEVWALAHSGKNERGLLCIDCLQKALGRSLTAIDFKPAPINLSIFRGMMIGA